MVLSEKAISVQHKSATVVAVSIDMPVYNINSSIISEILQLLDMLDRLLQERDDALSKLARIESELGQKTDENA